MPVNYYLYMNERPFLTLCHLHMVLTIVLFMYLKIYYMITETHSNMQSFASCSVTQTVYASTSTWEPLWPWSRQVKSSSAHVQANILFTAVQYALIILLKSFHCHSQMFCKHHFTNPHKNKSKGIITRDRRLVHTWYLPRE